MRKNNCAADELVEIDLEGYLEGLEDPAAETECFDLTGKEA